jgi:hypothetical protein
MIRLRGHHLLCLLSFSGEGYSPEFTRRFGVLAEAYREGKVGVQVLAAPDDACAACPFLGDAGCRSPADGPEAGVAALDQAVLDALGIEVGIHEAEDLLRRVATLSGSELHRLCRACSWYGKTRCQAMIREESGRLTGGRTD